MVLSLFASCKEHDTAKATQPSEASSAANQEMVESHSTDSEKGLSIEPQESGTTLAELDLDVPEPIKNETNSGTRWALLVGVNDYEDPAIADLQFASRDVELLGHLLETRGEFDTIYTFSSGAEQERLPTRLNINRAVDFIANNAEPEDLILVFYSGHGFASEGENYMCVQDSLLNDIVNTGVNIDKTIEKFKKSPAKVSVAFIDACRELISENTKSIKAFSFTDSQFMDVEGVVTLYATRFGDFSYEEESLGQGVFSHFVIGGLQGQADKNGDQYVSFKELSEHVIEKVNSWSRENMKTQKPFLSGEWSGDVLLTKKGGELSKADLAQLSPKGVMEAYYSAWTWQERIPHILNAEEKVSEMEQYYGGKPLDPSRFTGYEFFYPEETGAPKVQDPDVALVYIRDKKEGWAPFAFVLRKTPQGWKVDWYPDQTPPQVSRIDLLQIDRPGTVEEARRLFLTVSLNTRAPLNRFAPLQNEKYGFVGKYDGQLLYLYADKKSTAGQELYQLCRDYEEVPATVKVAYLTPPQPGRPFDVHSLDLVSFEHVYFY